ncbi:aspartic peptidase domain-containing protein [Earliella scabrosa]|nr:aspartic peptidase domain-containing protein [Earliella scabrosa]
MREPGLWDKLQSHTVHVRRSTDEHGPPSPEAPIRRYTSAAIPLREDGRWLFACSGVVGVGTPAQNVEVYFNTAYSMIDGIDSPDNVAMTVLSAPCNAGLYANTTKYNPDQSESAELVGAHSSNGTQGNLLYNDTVNIGGVSVSNLTLAARGVECKHDFADPRISGTIGLGVPVKGSQSFISQAYEQGAIPAPVFGMKHGERAEISLGAPNTALYTGDVEYHDVLAESDDLNLTSPLWAIGGGDVYVNEQLVATNITGLLWSNFPYILAPQPAFERSYQAAAGSGDVLDPDSWLMELPCNSTPRIEFNWGGRNWSLSESNSYLDSEEGSSDRHCYSSIFGSNLGSGFIDHVWYLGESFMANFYTVFNYSETEGARIGFATLAESS